MPGPSAIEWTQSTWNPITGCSKVSPGCAHCYAETFAERWRGIPGHAYEQGFDLRLWPERLEHPFRWKKPRVIFVNSMSDMFHEDVPEDFIAAVFEVMERANHHVYQVLTKRHERMAELAAHLPWPPHVWMGVSIENRRFVHRADYLRRVPAAVRFISAEPLLGYLGGLDLNGIDWVIAGGESGPKHRPVKAAWIRDVRDRCRRAGVAFFFKQWGGNRAKSGGRELDGREYNAMPRHDIRMAFAPTGAPVSPQRRRQRDLPDDADEKWYYTAHTAAKHEILRRYLGAWLAILGRGTRGRRFRHKQLVLVDGFAGRGRYMGGESGSPKIMFDRAVQVVDAGLAETVLIRCAEPKAKNFAHLEEVCEQLTHERVRIVPTQQRFEELGAEVIQEASRFSGPARPTFVMVDPYGVRGVPLSLLKRLMNFDRVELLLTLMVRDPARFLCGENYAKPLTALFGGDAWRDCREDEGRGRCLMLRFRDVVVPDVAQYALPFRVFEDEKKTELYYLVHLTNSALGMREMKKAMVKGHGDMTFWPITVRDPDQLELDVAEPKPFQSLQAHLATRYSGRALSFVELLNADFSEGAWLEPHYRAALNGMAREDSARVAVRRQGLTDGGKPRTHGIKHEDTLVFP